MPDAGELRRQEYVGRVNRAIDYVRENLNGDLRLETIARAANFSPYHFHRIFRSVVGETVNAFVRRHRAQKAAGMLIHSPGMTITEIAVACGYSSPSLFAREFRTHYGASASQFRAGGPTSVDRLRQELTRQGHVLQRRHAQRTEMSFRVQVREEPARHVAYIRHVGNYSDIGHAIERLARWAGSRGLFREDTRMLAVYLDNPDVTPVDKLRSDACITVPRGTPVQRDIGRTTLPGGAYAAAYVEIDIAQYGEAWDRLFSDWLPESGYQPDDRPCYELYLNNPEEHPERKHILEICEPIRPL